MGSIGRRESMVVLFCYICSVSPGLGLVPGHDTAVYDVLCVWVFLSLLFSSLIQTSLVCPSLHPRAKFTPTRRYVPLSGAIRLLCTRVVLLPSSEAIPLILKLPSTPPLLVAANK